MASAAVQNKTPRKVLKKSTRDSLIAYSFIAPNFIGFCVFTLVPMVFAIALAFCAWDGRHAIEFVGLKNFVKLFTTDKIFQAALKNTIVYVIGTVPLTLAPPPLPGLALYSVMVLPLLLPKERPL